MQIWLKNYTNQLLDISIKETYTHLLQTTVGVLILLQVISKFNEGIRFLLSVIDIFSKCAWVVPLKDKKCIPITNAFQKAFKESGHKPDKIWVDKGSEFYNRLMKSFLQNNNIEMYSTHN